ncbi:hypothetical protein C8Q78DRAFT_1056579, partial [Trametes maxima]
MALTTRFPFVFSSFEGRELVKNTLKKLPYTPHDYQLDGVHYLHVARGHPMPRLLRV